MGDSSFEGFPKGKPKTYSSFCSELNIENSIQAANVLIYHITSWTSPSSLHVTSSLDRLIDHSRSTICVYCTLFISCNFFVVVNVYTRP